MGAFAVPVVVAFAVQQRAAKVCVPLRLRCTSVALSVGEKIARHGSNTVVSAVSAPRKSFDILELYKSDYYYYYYYFKGVTYVAFNTLRYKLRSFFYIIIN